MSEGKARYMIGSLALFPEACVLALQGIVELNAKGLADSRFETCLHWECVLVKMPVGHDLVPAAVLCFTHDAPRALLWVQLSYVAEQFRGRGVYKAAYAALRPEGLCGGRTWSEVLPKRRSRWLKSAMAASSSAAPNSGQSLSVKYSSA